MATLAEVKAVGEKIHAQDPGMDVRALAAAIARAAGPGGAVYAGVAAKGIIDAGKSAVDAVTAPAQAVADAAGVARQAVELPIRVLTWLTDPPTWERIAYVVGGGVLILVAAKMLVENQVAGVVGKVAGVAGAVAPAGKVAKVAGAVSGAAKAAGKG